MKEVTKSLLSFFLVLALLSFGTIITNNLPVLAQKIADTTVSLPDDDTSIKFNFDSSTATLTVSGSGNMDNFSLKFEHTSDGIKSVTDTPWNSYLGLVKKIVVEDGITSIGSCAFFGSSVEKVVLSDSVKALNDSCFGNCKNLISITMNGITDIRSSVFLFCESLKCFDIPHSLKSIGNEAFYGCKFNTITLPKNVKYEKDTFPDKCVVIKSDTLEQVTHCEKIIPAKISFDLRMSKGEYLELFCFDFGNYTSNFKSNNSKIAYINKFGTLDCEKKGKTVITHTILDEHGTSVLNAYINVEVANKTSEDSLLNIALYNTIVSLLNDNPQTFCDLMDNIKKYTNCSTNETFSINNIGTSKSSPLSINLDITLAKKDCFKCFEFDAYGYKNVLKTNNSKVVKKDKDNTFYCKKRGKAVISHTIKNESGITLLEIHINVNVLNNPSDDTLFNKTTCDTLVSLLNENPQSILDFLNILMKK